MVLSPLREQAHRTARRTPYPGFWGISLNASKGPTGRHVHQPLPNTSNAVCECPQRPGFQGGRAAGAGTTQHISKAGGGRVWTAGSTLDLTITQLRYPCGGMGARTSQVTTHTLTRPLVHVLTRRMEDGHRQYLHGCAAQGHYPPHTPTYLPTMLTPIQSMVCTRVIHRDCQRHRRACIRHTKGCFIETIKRVLCGMNSPAPCAGCRAQAG